MVKNSPVTVIVQKFKGMTKILEEIILGLYIKFVYWIHARKFHPVWLFQQTNWPNFWYTKLVNININDILITVVYMHLKVVLVIIPIFDCWVWQTLDQTGDDFRGHKADVYWWKSQDIFKYTATNNWPAHTLRHSRSISYFRKYDYSGWYMYKSDQKYKQVSIDRFSDTLLYGS